MKDKPKTSRFAVSINTDLLNEFNDLLKEKNYPNRSQAVQDIIRNYIIEEKWDEAENTMGTITMVFNHHKRNLTETLTKIQHDYNDEIISNTHVHLTHENCLEVIIVKGKGSKIRALANQLIQTKGVLHGKLTLTTAGE